MERMAIVKCNSLAALYNIRQKFEICPTRNALWFSFVLFFFCNNWSENHLERKATFCLILISQIWFVFQSEVSLFPHIPQTAVDMKWCPCVKELVKGSCQLVSELMPAANVVNQKVRFHERPEQKLIILFLQQFNGFWYAVATPYIGNRAKCCRP